jgi:FkbM family methyltransferase
MPADLAVIRTKEELAEVGSVGSELVDVRIVKRVDTFERDRRFAQWKHPSEADKFRHGQSSFDAMANFFGSLVCPGSVAIDIGAHGGDTTIPMAAAVGVGGLVLAFEPGPPWEILKSNVLLNAPSESMASIHAYHFAVDTANGEWCYFSECGGCNGFKVPCGSRGGRETKLRATRLDDLLARNYPPEMLGDISFVKIDTEGHDAEIVASFVKIFGQVDGARPSIQVEWFDKYRHKFCSSGTRKIFDAAKQIGYEVYRFQGPVESFGVGAAKASDFAVLKSCNELRGKEKLRDLYMFPSERGAGRPACGPK